MVRAGKQPFAGEKSLVDDLLGNAATVLEVAKELAPLIPIPALGSIFASGSVIINVAQQVKQNKEDCARLASHVASLVRDICKEVHGREELISDRLSASLEQINSDLEEIRQFMHALEGQNWLKRTFKRDYATNQLKVFNAKLDFSLQTFKALSNIRMELKIEQIDRRLITMDTRAHNERQWDGQYRIYRLADLELLRLVTREEGIYYDTQAANAASSSSQIRDSDSEIIKPYVIEHYEARLNDGRVVTVKMAQGHLKVFKESLEALKQFRHVNIAQLEGYSDDKNTQFQVIKGGLNPMVAKMASLPTFERYLKYFDLVSSVFNTINQLRSRNMVIHSSSANTLMCHPLTGEVVLGVHDRIAPSDGPVDPGNLCSVWNLDWFLSEAIISDDRDHVCFYLRTDINLPTQSNATSALSHLIASNNNKSLTLPQALKSFITFRNILHGNNIRATALSLPYPPITTGCLGFFHPTSGFQILGRLKVKEGFVSDQRGVVEWIVNKYFVGENIDLGPSAHIDSKIQISKFLDAPKVDSYQLWEFLTVYGYSLAKNAGVPLENLLIVKDTHLNLRASCTVASTTQNPFDSPGVTYFHRLPISSSEGKEIPKPWGYFSRSVEPQSPSESTHLAEDSSGIQSEITHEWIIDMFRFSPLEASMVKWFHENLPNPNDKGKQRETDGSARIVEV